MPDFGSTAANELFSEIAAAAPPEAPQIAAARRAMERVGSREGRDMVAAQLIHALPLDTDPTDTTNAIRAVQAELDAADTTLSPSDELARQVAEALQPEPADTRSMGEKVYDTAIEAGIRGDALDRVTTAANHLDGSQADDGEV